MTDQFQHIMVLISIIIGLGMTHLLSGVIDAIDRANDDDNPKINSAVNAIWAATIFLWMVNFWWFQFRLLAAVATWTIGRYFLIILYSVALYALAVILVPRDWNAISNFTARFLRNRRWFFLAFLWANISDVIDSFLKGGWDYVIGIGPITNAVVLATIPVTIIGIRSINIRTQTIMAAIYFVAHLISIFEHAPTLSGK